METLVLTKDSLDFEEDSANIKREVINNVLHFHHGSFWLERWWQQLILFFHKINL